MLDIYDILTFVITAEMIHQHQELRKQQLKEKCDVEKETFSQGKHSLQNMSGEDLKNLIVDDTHGIIYCYIPKVIET